MPPISAAKIRYRLVNRPAFALIVLIAISVLVRIVIGLNFRERISWDTEGYIVTAQSIASLDFTQYDGRRTPIYPLLLLLSGMDTRVVRWIQCGLGIGIASMLFVITWHRTRSTAMALVVGLLSSLAISELLFEQIIYSETLCTFWIVLSLLAFERIDAGRRPNSQPLPFGEGESVKLWYCALLGISAALAGMTRPMFLFLGPLYFCFSIAGMPRWWNALLAMVLAPTLIFAIGWSVINKHTIDYFGVTTTTGYNLSNHSGAFMELAPPQYSTIRDIYLRYRAWQVPRIGSQAMTIWYAEGEIKRTTGLSTAELSKQLTRMSLEMFAQHPILYLESVARSWVRFWGFGFYRYLGSFRDSTTSSMYARWLAFGTLQLAINLMFLIVATYSIAQWMMRRISFDFDLAVITIVLAGSFVQALLEYGENVRYLVPLVPLTIYTAVVFLLRKRRSAFAIRRE